MQQGRIVFDDSPAAYSSSSRLIIEPADKIGTERSCRGGECVLSIERVSFGYNGCKAALDDVSLSVVRARSSPWSARMDRVKARCSIWSRDCWSLATGRLPVQARPAHGCRGLGFPEPRQPIVSRIPSLRSAHSLPRNQHLSTHEVSSRTLRALAQVGLQSQAERVPFSLSYGEKRRLTLASTLSGRSTVLCLDEPTVGLDGDCLGQVAGFSGKSARSAEPCCWRRMTPIL